MCGCIYEEHFEDSAESELAEIRAGLRKDRDSLDVIHDMETEAA